MQAERLPAYGGRDFSSLRNINFPEKKKPPIFGGFCNRTGGETSRLWRDRLLVSPYFIKKPIQNWMGLYFVQAERLELSHLSALDPKSSVSTNSTTPAKTIFQNTELDPKSIVSASRWLSGPPRLQFPYRLLLLRNTMEKELSVKRGCKYKAKFQFKNN